MTQKTNTSTKQETTVHATIAQEAASSRMWQDLKTSVLIVSLVANLVILIAWITLQVTTQYDAQVAGFLFTR